MHDLPIAKQIQALNKLALSAMLLVAVIGVAASLWLTTVFRNFVDSTKRTEIVQEISEDVFEGRIAAFKYRISPSENFVSELNENLVEAVEAKDRLMARLSNDPANSQLVENVGPELTFYDTAFAEMVGLPPTAHGVLTTGGSMAMTALSSWTRSRSPPRFSEDLRRAISTRISRIARLAMA